MDSSTMCLRITTTLCSKPIGVQHPTCTQNHHKQRRPSQNSNSQWIRSKDRWLSEMILACLAMCTNIQAIRQHLQPQMSWTRRPAKQLALSRKGFIQWARVISHQFQAINRHSRWEHPKEEAVHQMVLAWVETYHPCQSNSLIRGRDLRREIAGPLVSLFPTRVCKWWMTMSHQPVFHPSRHE